MGRKVKSEITKLIEAKFIEVVEYPTWLANIVPVAKKDGRVRVCIDYRDLNKASPKDDFPLPHIDVLVDSAVRAAMYSFLDGFSGYNQIMMDIIDKVKTAFIIEWGTYCYRVIFRESQGPRPHISSARRRWEVKYVCSCVFIFLWHVR